MKGKGAAVAARVKQKLVMPTPSLRNYRKVGTKRVGSMLGFGELEAAPLPSNRLGFHRTKRI